MEQLPGLLGDRRHDARVRMAGHVDRDPGAEVEEPVPVDVLDDRPATANGNDRVGPRQRRRRVALVEGDVGAGLRAG